MQQEDLNRLRMLRATAAQLEELKPIWNANPMMHLEVAELRRLIADIELAHAKTMAAAGKDQREVARTRKEAAIDAMMVIVNVTRTWAERVAGEELLVQRLSARPYALRTMSEARLIARMEELYEHCISSKANIPENPLSAEDYRNARACLDAFRGLQDTARKSDVERQGENENLQALFKQVTPVLKRIDRLMENYKLQHPADCAKYRAARKIYDYGTGPRKPKENGASPAA